MILRIAKEHTAMVTTRQNSLPQRNPQTEHRHQREVIWQILVPLGVGGIGLILVAVLSAGLGSDGTRRLADISAIWLIAGWMVGAFIWLLSLVVSIYILQKVIQVLPSQSFRLHILLLELQKRLGILGDRSVAPVLKANSFAASFRRLFSWPITGKKHKPVQ